MGSFLQALLPWLILASTSAFRRTLLRRQLIPSNALLRNPSRLFFKVAEADETVAIDEDVEFATIDDAGLLQKLSKGFVPLAASIGFAATPSPLVATRLAGAGEFQSTLCKSLAHMCSCGRGGRAASEDPPLVDDGFVRERRAR